jgi:conjugal transfer pilus assembly protein TraU
MAWLLVLAWTAVRADGNLKPGCPDAKVFGAGLITDICWSCLFPIRIAGVELGGQGTAPAGASQQKLCVCPDPLGVPEPGMVMGLWQPARLIEVVRLPYCSPSLGGVFLRRYTRLLGGNKGPANDPTDAIFYHYHYYAFPLLIMLDLFTDADCNPDGYHDFDLLYLSELDPTWNSDELAFLLNPETAVFANPVALAACVVDGASATAGQPQDSLFWCAGTWGNLYPLTGNLNWEGSPPRDSSLIATRAVAALHRRGLAWKTMGDSALCRGHIHPFILKTQYKLSQYYPLAEANGNHWIGQSTFTWGEWRNLPAVGEDFVHILWRWTDCCLRF